MPQSQVEAEIPRVGACAVSQQGFVGAEGDFGRHLCMPRKAAFMHVQVGTTIWYLVSGIWYLVSGIWTCNALCERAPNSRGCLANALCARLPLLTPPRGLEVCALRHSCLPADPPARPCCWLLTTPTRASPSQLQGLDGERGRAQPACIHYWVPARMWRACGVRSPSVASSQCPCMRCVKPAPNTP